MGRTLTSKCYDIVPCHSFRSPQTSALAWVIPGDQEVVPVEGVLFWEGTQQECNAIESILQNCHFICYLKINCDSGRASGPTWKLAIPSSNGAFSF